MSNFVIYNLETGKRYKAPKAFSDTFYATEAAAKGQLTRLTKGLKAKLVAGEWAVMEFSSWRAQYPVKMVERINMMSGLPYMESEDTPCYCSPACESYWSI